MLEDTATILLLGYIKLIFQCVFIVIAIKVFDKIVKLRKENI